MSMYETISEERKKLQAEGLVPSWMTTAGWQMFRDKYLYNTDQAFYGQAQRIAATAAKHTPNPAYWAPKFFELIWRGWLSCSTPVLSNMGTTRGLPVSCSGQVIGDSIHSFYSSLHETAMLTKNGFGTAGYLGDIRPRGSVIKSGGKSSGSVPVFKTFVQTMRDVSQGNCYHPEVEVLTEKGFMTFSTAASSGLAILQVSETGENSFTKEVQWVEQDFTGNLVNFKDSKNIDISVTPNHRMFYKKRSRIDHRRPEGRYINNTKVLDANFTVVSAQECPTHRDIVFYNSVNVVSPDSSLLSPYERFLIAFQADGTFVKNYKKVPVASGFHFKKQRKIDRLISILDQVGFEYTLTEQKGGTYQFYVKHVPTSKTFDWVNLQLFNSSKAKEFLLEVSQWDGTRVKYDAKDRLGFDYCSIIKQNSDTIQSMASICGFKSKVYCYTEREGNRCDIYRVTLSEGSDFGGGSVIKTEIPYSGKVYCAVVPFGGLVVRSNGHTLVCGNTRRGAWAGYLPMDHGDFDEIADYVKENPDDANLGWVIRDSDMESLELGFEEAERRFQKMLKLKCLTGKGYFFFPDKANRRRPKMYVDRGLEVKTSQLCSEIMLYSDADQHTYTCVLSSMNLAHYDEWKDTDAVQTATVFLDCVASEFIERAKEIPALHKAVRFTEKSRALGLGVCGFHTYLQKNMIAFESLAANFANQQIFKHIDDESLIASKWMAENWGEPEWCVGYGVRNTHRMAIAPTMSTALIMGGVSQGIEPVIGNCFIQASAAGEQERINPVFLDLMKARGKYTRKLVKEIAEKHGSVQHLDWLTDDERMVFKTAFEINQEVILRLASIRQKYIDQGQSLNLFFSAEESEENIARIHQIAFEDEGILSLYYLRTQAGVSASNGECIACQ